MQGHQPGQRVDQLALPVAVDARDAHNLALVHVKADAVHRLLVVAAGDRQVAHRQGSLAGGLLLLVQHEADLAAHHHLGHLLDRGIGYLYRAHIGPLAQHRHPVGHGLDFGQLVGDKQDALALLGQAPHDVHQLVNLPGCEHGGGLVKDEDLVVAVQHLEDFHPLLHAHRDVLDVGIRVDAQAILPGQPHHLLPGLVHLEHTVLGGFHPQHDVLQHREIMHQLEMLVHHADAQGVGVVGVAHLHGLAVLADLSPVGLVQAKQDAHQRGLAGAVFAQQGVNLSPPQLQRDVIIGADAGKILGDVEHFDDIVLHRSPFVRIR